MKTIVIGGGPAGMMSAIEASNFRKNGFIRKKTINNWKRQM